MPVFDISLPTCPACGIDLNPEGRTRFDCPGCGKTLVVARSRVYWICRYLGIYGLAATWAWRRGWDPSFIVFVVSFYAFPVMWLWNSMERYFWRIYPPANFELQRSLFQSLGI